MKVYGYSQIDAGQGEIGAAEFAPKQNVLDLLGILEHELGWEWAYADFRDAQRNLVLMMLDEKLDPELIQGVRDCRAGDVPVQFVKLED